LTIGTFLESDFYKDLRSSRMLHLKFLKFIQQNQTEFGETFDNCSFRHNSNVYEAKFSSVKKDIDKYFFISQIYYDSNISKLEDYFFIYDYICKTHVYGTPKANEEKEEVEEANAEQAEQLAADEEEVKEVTTEQLAADEEEVEKADEAKLLVAANEDSQKVTERINLIREQESLEPADVLKANYGKILRKLYEECDVMTKDQYAELRKKMSKAHALIQPNLIKNNIYSLPSIDDVTCENLIQIVLESLSDVSGGGKKSRKKSKPRKSRKGSRKGKSKKHTRRSTYSKQY
jgi:hypothetical protein